MMTLKKCYISSHWEYLIMLWLHWFTENIECPFRLFRAEGSNTTREFLCDSRHCRLFHKTMFFITSRVVGWRKNEIKFPFRGTTFIFLACLVETYYSARSARQSLAGPFVSIPNIHTKLPYDYLLHVFHNDNYRRRCSLMRCRNFRIPYIHKHTRSLRYYYYYLGSRYPAIGVRDSGAAAAAVTDDGRAEIPRGASLCARNDTRA